MPKPLGKTEIRAPTSLYLSWAASNLDVGTKHTLRGVNVVKSVSAVHHLMA